MPPSINAQLAVRGGVLRKTSAAHDFDLNFKRWKLQNRIDVDEAQIFFKRLLAANPALFLRVDCYFVFHVERLLTKTKRAKSPVKALDANNRLKSCLDKVSEIIGVDDKHFVTGVCEKVFCESKHQEQVIVKIRETELRVWTQI